MTPSVRTLGIIPARYGSTRFPGKPLVDISGKSMIQRVWEQASLAKLDTLVVATDDDRIYEFVASFGTAMMTSPHHMSGTDRCAEVADRLDPDFGYDVVINVQGDQPFIDPDIIDRLILSVAEPDVEISTLCCPIKSSRELLDPASVKVVLATSGKALYFSRSPIPFVQGRDTSEWTESYSFKKHIGTYGFKRRVLSQVAALAATPLEGAEQLEQLRWLERGYSISVIEVTSEVKSIDRPEDLD
jgi:3-deoxy-manno-octulosonate cytidylyltransferase (CMP-KDO synthetase)